MITQPTQSIIQDPVTGNQYSRDTSVAGSTYAPYQGSTLLPKVDTTQPIPAAKLNTPPTPLPPPVNTTTAQDALGIHATTAADSAYTSQQQDATAAAQTPAAPVQKNALQTVLDKIMSDSTALGEKGNRTLEIQNQEGVDTKKKAQTDIENQILSKTRAYDKQIQAIQTQPGITTDAANAKVAEVERQKNSELSDLAIQQKVAQDDYQGASEIALAKVNAEFEPLQNEIDTLKTYYQLAQNDMTESEKQQAEAAIQQKQDEVKFGQQKELAALQHKYQLSETAFTHSFDNQRSPAVDAASTKLTAAKGADGFTDPNLYASLRSKSTLSPTDFDNRFGYLVNPASTARLGIGAASTGQNAQFATPSAADKSAVFGAIGADPTAASTIDMTKLQTDPTYFYWVKSQLGA